MRPQLNTAQASRSIAPKHACAVLFCANMRRADFMARSRREKEISEELSAEKKSAVAVTPDAQNVKCKNRKKGTDQMKTQNMMVRCPMTLPDCAARTAYGLCECLNSVGYSDARPCPFYKPRDQNAAENARALERLRNTGRSALLEKYHNAEAEGESE